MFIGINACGTEGKIRQFYKGPNLASNMALIPRVML